MKKRLLAAVMALLCLLSLLPAASATTTAPCLNLDSKTVLIGDSNTVFLKKNNSDIQVARIFARVNGRIDECVENYSSWIVDGYSQTMYQLISGLSGSSFHTVVINMGTNHCGSSLSNFKTKYRQLLNNLLAKNQAAVIYVCKILPINPANITGQYSSAFTLTEVNKINNAVAELQAEFSGNGHDVRLLDLHTPMADSSGRLKSEYDSGGGIHLNVKGYKRMNQLIQTALAQGDPNGNHQWGSPYNMIQPTCTETGWAEYSCGVCGAKKGVVLPANGGHSWDAGTLISEAGCLSPGQIRYVCKACGQVRLEVVPALGHSWALTMVWSEDPEDLHGGSARYVCQRCGQIKEARICAGEIFTDMPAETHWSHKPIDWAWYYGVTGGTGPNSFSPNAKVTRAEAVTFLWAAAGRPEPSSAENPFTDVQEGRYYYKPVLWALENGVTGGKTATSFAPKAQCTRAEIMTFIWTAAGKPAHSLEESPFTDVPEGKYYYNPILWAYENGVTGGTTETTFSPKTVCTRAQVVTFLYRVQELLQP